MKRHIRKIALVCVCAALLVIGVSKVKKTSLSPVVISSPVPTSVPVPSCDDSLWDHVYHPARLQVVERCKEVTGLVYSIREEPDGDLHVRLTADDASIINSANVSGQLGKLVVEPICTHVVTQSDAIPSCAGFTGPTIIDKNFPLGTHVKVTGSYVLDKQHGGWAEIHPVTSFEIIP